MKRDALPLEQDKVKGTEEEKTAAAKKFAEISHGESQTISRVFLGNEAGLSLPFTAYVSPYAEDVMGCQSLNKTTL